jgi:hypothetical protein
MYIAESKRKIVQDPALSFSVDGPLFRVNEDANEPRKWADISDPCELLAWAS